MLHTLQDFYTHSNWIEVTGPKKYIWNGNSNNPVAISIEDDEVKKIRSANLKTCIAKSNLNDLITDCKLFITKYLLGSKLKLNDYMQFAVNFLPGAKLKGNDKEDSSLIRQKYLDLFDSNLSQFDPKKPPVHLYFHKDMHSDSFISFADIAYHVKHNKCAFDIACEEALANTALKWHEIEDKLKTQKGEDAEVILSKFKNYK